jgi:uncharacterized membrane protein (UPF0127 family)
MLVNVTRRAILCSRVRVAETFIDRFVGLLGLHEMGADSGLIIEPCASVHTFGMSFAIDIVMLGADYRVLGVSENVPPWRVRFCPARTRRVLELPAGTLKRSGLAVGDELRFETR